MHSFLSAQMISSDFSNLLMFCDAMGMILVDLIPIFSITKQTKHQKHHSNGSQATTFTFCQSNLEEKETFLGDLSL